VTYPELVTYPNKYIFIFSSKGLQSFKHFKTVCKKEETHKLNKIMLICMSDPENFKAFLSKTK